VTLTANLGSHLQRSGVRFRTNVEHSNWQAFSSIKFQWNKKGFGPINNSIESIISLGGSFTHGDLNPTDDSYAYLPFTLFREAKQKYSYGYSFDYFIDRHKTSQGTGSVLIKLDDFYLIGTNDILGNLSGRDQYRTGSFAIAYTHDQVVVYSKVLMWTGQTRCAKMKRVKQPVSFRSKYGYKDNSECNYSHLSHGILSIGGVYRVNSHWMPMLEIGRDDERIRNTVQNRLIHDMPFIPAKWNGAQNLHIPMIDSDGELYLFKEGQKVKPSKWFLQMGLNDGISY